jgi:antitoxin YefM
MEITTYTDFRQNMRAYFEKVFNMRAPLFISRPKGHDMVLISKSEYTSMQETFHLLRSPKNAERLLQALEQDQAGKGAERTLLEG